MARSFLLARRSMARRPLARPALPLPVQLLATLTMLAGCGAADLTASLPGGEPQLLVAPLALGEIASILPLGNLNPPDHALPTDHVYFLFVGPGTTHRVLAPGDGVVLRVLSHAPGDQRVWIGATRDVTYYLDHVRLSDAVKTGVRVRAGQELGVTSQDAALDLGAYDRRRTLPGLVTPSRYTEETVHAIAPIALFAEPLRSQLYAKVRRLGADRDGRIGFDVAGTLAGNWFLEGLRADRTSAGPEARGKQIAFVADPFDPSVPRISVGGSLAMRGVYTIGGGEPRFEAVTPASGVVRYTLRYQPTDAPVGTLLVQLTAPDRIRVEAFSGGAGPAAFTSAAATFVR